MRWLAILLVPLALSAQAVVPIPTADFTYYSYSFQFSPPIPPALFTLNFPNQTTGAQDATGYCSTYSALAYNVYSYSGSTWTGPLSGPLDRYYANLDATTGYGPPILFQGTNYDISATGQIGSISDPSTQNYQQAWFWSSDRCYLAGPEFGFYKLFQATGANNTVYFYYATNGNCFVVGGLSSCRSKTDGSNVLPNGGTGNNAPSFAITIPSGTNSLGGTDWVYQAYASSSSAFIVRVRDPGTMADVVTPLTITVQSWFVPTMQSLFTTGLPGYVTITSQRNSPPGGITDSMSSPLRLSTYAIGSIMAMTPVVASGLGRLQGWCENGAQTVVVSSQSSTTRSQQSAPQCTVTVYVTGSGGTKAAIYSDSTGTPLSNPFTANGSGQWYFYAATNSPHYDVQLSGGTPTMGTITLGDNEISDVVSYQPHNVLAYPAGGFTGLIGVYDSHTQYTVGFTAPATLTGNIQWQLPALDAAGCLESNGSAVLSFGGCTPGGVSQSIQSNNGTGGFYGDGNLLWNPLTQAMTLTGISLGPVIRAFGGYIEGHGGFLSSANLWNGYNSVSDGALLAGYHVSQNGGSTAGGYVNFAELTYANYPLPLNGLASFGANSGLLWNSGYNQTASPIYGQSINSNMTMNAPSFQICLWNGSSCTPSPYNAIQAPNGGAEALSFTAANYVQTGHSAGAPTASLNDMFHQGALNWNDSAACEQVFNGVSWACLGSGGGGGGSPGTPQYSVQVNNPLGTFSGSSFLIWDVTDSPGNPYLKVTASGTTHAAIAAATGFMQADQGYLATSGTCLSFNCFNAPTAGYAGRSVTASAYMQVGQVNNVASLVVTGPGTGSTGACIGGTPGVGGCDLIVAGAITYDIGSSPGLKYYNGSAWITVASGSGSPGGSSTDVQYNSSGSFGGSGGKFTYTTPSGNPLVTIAATSGFAGLNVTGGYVQSVQGFYAATCTALNCLNMPDGGANALAFIAGGSGGAGGYVQTGNQATNSPALLSGDSPHPGLMFYNTSTSGGGPCEMVYSGSAYSCVGGGGSGSPGSPNLSFQYNNAGAFAGNAVVTYQTGGSSPGILLTDTTAGGSGAALIFKNTNSTAIYKWLREDNAGNFEIVNSAYSNILLRLDDAGDLFTGPVQATTVQATSSAGNAFSSSAGGATLYTFTAGSTAGNAYQCTTTCGATLTTFDATSALGNAIQAPNGGVTSQTMTATSSALQRHSGGERWRTRYVSVGDRAYLHARIDGIRHGGAIFSTSMAVRFLKCVHKCARSARRRFESFVPRR